MEQEQEIINEMVTEINAGLKAIDAQLVLLEKKSDNQDALNEIYRHLHSIKGVAGFFDYSGLESLSESAEQLIDKFRTQQKPLEAIHLNALNETISALRSINDDVVTHQKELEFSFQALLNTLNQLGSDGTEAPEPTLDEQLAQKNSAPPTPTADELLDKEAPKGKTDPKAELDDAISKAADVLHDKDYDKTQLELEDSLESMQTKIEQQDEQLSDILDNEIAVNNETKKAASVEELVAEEPIPEEPIPEEPIPEEPIPEEPIPEEPVAEEPVAEEPVAAEPVTEEPVTEEPVAEEPVAEEPIPEEPIPEEPIPEEPVAEEPVAAEPVAAEPVAAEPVAAEPVAEQASVIQNNTEDTMTEDTVLDIDKLDEKEQLANQAKLEQSALQETLSSIEKIQHQVKCDSTTAELSSSMGMTTLNTLTQELSSLVQAKNQLQHYTVHENNETLDGIFNTISNAANGLQDAILNSRSAPINSLIQLCQKHVDNYAKQYNKQVLLNVENEDARIDQSVLSLFEKPLELLIKNAIHHGLEGSEQRKQRSKAETGKLSLSTQQKNGRCYLRLADDGKSLKMENMRERLVSKAIIPAEEIKTLSDESLLNRLLHPGAFNDSPTLIETILGEEIDEIKNYLESIGGSIEASTHIDSGTQFEISLPQPLAIVPSLVVLQNGLYYSLPANEIIEVIDIAYDDLEHLFGAVIYRFGDALLPVVALDHLLEQQSSGVDNSSPLTMVVINTDGDHYGLLIEQVINTQDLLIQPLSKALQSVMIYQGTTILGNNAISLLLNLKALAQKAKLSSQSKSSLQGE